MISRKDRIKECGKHAFIELKLVHDTIYNLSGTIYSYRRNKCSQPLKITNTPVKPTQNI